MAAVEKSLFKGVLLFVCILEVDESDDVRINRELEDENNQVIAVSKTCQFI